MVQATGLFPWADFPIAVRMDHGARIWVFGLALKTRMQTPIEFVPPLLFLDKKSHRLTGENNVLRSDYFTRPVCVGTYIQCVCQV